MDFPRTDAALAVCKLHLDATNSRNTEIESYLVGYLLATIYAEFEQKMRAIVCKRVERAGDQHVHNFAISTMKVVMKTINVSGIKGIIGYLDSASKQTLGDCIDDTTQAAYDNIINNRHGVAHASGSNMTFAELEATLPGAKAVIELAADALGLTPAEVASINAT